MSAIKGQSFSREILKTCCSLANLLLQPEDRQPAILTEGQKNRLERGIVCQIFIFVDYNQRFLSSCMLVMA